ncbi:phosphorylated adapter RNA export protein isoform 2-T2 [Alca torda]
MGSSTHNICAASVISTTAPTRSREGGTTPCCPPRLRRRQDGVGPPLPASPPPPLAGVPDTHRARASHPPALPIGERGLLRAAAASGPRQALASRWRWRRVGWRARWRTASSPTRTPTCPAPAPPGTRIRNHMLAMIQADHSRVAFHPVHQVFLIGQPKVWIQVTKAFLNLMMTAVCGNENDRNVSAFLLLNLSLFRLCEPKKDLIARVVKIIGKRKAIELLMETAEVEQNGGLFIVNGTRRRTPGGVYLNLLKNTPSIKEEQIKEIFYLENQKEYENKKAAKKRRIQVLGKKMKKAIKGLNLQEYDDASRETFASDTNEALASLDDLQEGHHEAKMEPEDIIEIDNAHDLEIF